jgi:hypothetical protein
MYPDECLDGSGDIFFDHSLLSLDSNLIFFPVRHHSPTAARLLRQLIDDYKPAALLIEGPSDFNDRIAELSLPHRLPIAIYSYFQQADGIRRGAFYPFCVYSPEWQAIVAAQNQNIPVQFIDLPWADRPTDRVLGMTDLENGYSDETMNRGDYIAALCDQLGLEDLDAVWDQLFEIDSTLTLADYLERCHYFCWHLRQGSGPIAPLDLARESFMVARIQAAIDRYAPGFEPSPTNVSPAPRPIVIITGGFHSSALHAALRASQTDRNPANQNPTAPHLNQGIALTPYSYERLDGLTGYNAGMPNPGFYHAVWTHRDDRHPSPSLPPATDLLRQVITTLRQKKQTASTADLIAVQTMAQGLADLRGHGEIWRRDLIDGIIGGLVKEELNPTRPHPFLIVLQALFRGSDRGCLAEGTPLPPLVQEIHQRLRDRDLFPLTVPRSVTLSLTDRDIALAEVARQSSALLHNLRLLQIQGIAQTGGTDFAAGSDLVEIWETWSLHWTPSFDGSAIEAAVYGPSLAEATIAKLQERAAAIDRNAEQAALLLLDAALAAVDALSEPLSQMLIRLIRQESNFLVLGRSLQHLLYLYRYDDVLGTQNQDHIAQILAEAFQRGLWLLDQVGQHRGEEDALLKGLGRLIEAYERSGQLLTAYRDAFLQCLERMSQDPQQLPILRGGAIGALWGLGATPTEQTVPVLRDYSQPEKLGDFLTGLFHLARETTQRDGALVLTIDDLILAYDPEEFLVALPALRLAFAYFTPREKYGIAKTLVEATSDESPSTARLSTHDLLTLPLGAAVSAAAIAFESQLFAIVDRYSLRGNSRADRSQGESP